MTSASPEPASAAEGGDAWPGLARLAAQAAQVLEMSGRIAGTGGSGGGSGGSGGGSGGSGGGSGGSGGGSGGSGGSDDGARLRESMQDELGGLRAAIDYVIGQNQLDWVAINRQRDRKRALYERH